MDRERNGLRTRTGGQEDVPFILGLVPRLTAFPLPVWRRSGPIEATSETILRRALSAPGPDEELLIAEDDAGTPLGFIHLDVVPEFFSGEREGYIANLAVAEAAEGRGVGRALMAAAEAWSRARGCPSLGLYVFAGNERARDFYRHLGFGEDHLKLVKVLPKGQG